MIFLLSAGRSGSTWLGKIFDSHPEVFYLHEPDIDDRGIDLLPYWFEQPPSPTEIRNAGLYLDRLATSRSLRTTGTMPFFLKSYRGPIPEAVRQGVIVAGKGIETVGLSSLSRAITIPDLAKKGRRYRTIVKSVSALGRVEAFVAARPEIQPVLLVRHPCGYVNSMLRGASSGLMKLSPNLGRLGRTRSARGLGLLEDDAVDTVATLAWQWLISNVEALNAIANHKTCLVNYDKLANDPDNELRKLFQDLDLGWPRQTEQFVRRTQMGGGGYYSVFRGQGASDAWRSQLDERAVAEVRRVAERHPIGREFVF